MAGSAMRSPSLAAGEPMAFTKPDISTPALSSMTSNTREKTGQDLEVGRLKLTIQLAEAEGQEPKVINLIKLDIHKEHQRKGYGRKAVEACVQLSPGELRICDIKKSKLGFWKKLGIQNVRTRGFIEGIIPREPKQTNVPEEPAPPAMSL